MDDDSSLISSLEIRAFQNKVFTFYAMNKRDLPWRSTADPYKILVSEIMLQQTQVPRVISYYERWIDAWPTIHDLAKASRKDVLKAWMGLGYNSRAMRLHQAADIIATKFDGDVLKAMQYYKDVPGVGLYTSKAVRIFAANQDVATVDTNIRRILIHEFDLSENIADSQLMMLAQRCLPTGKSRDWHNALMDYGSQVLTARTTKISPKTKQSRFEGSDRQIRAHLIRLLLQQPCSFSELQQQMQGTPQRVQSIVEKLVDERLIQETNGVYTIKE